MKNKINKNIFIKTCKCTKAAFLHHFYPKRRMVDPNLEFVFRRSKKVEELARKLFPEGQDVGTSHKNFQGFVDYTKLLLSGGAEVIYQAQFQSSVGRCKCDILMAGYGKWKIFKVKSSTKIEEQHILDMAYQLKILKSCFPNIKFETYIIYLNKEYIREDKLNLDDLFNIDEVTTRTRLAQPLVDKYLKVATKVLSDREPTVDIGLQCNKYYKCEFKNYCWKNVPGDSVFDISRLWESKKFQLHDQGIIKLEDVPRKLKLNENQWMQIDCHVQKRDVINPDLIEEFLKDVKFPIYFMDFETYQSPIPRYKNTSVYSQIPFQFSVHCLQYNTELQHKEFLYSFSKEDPRIQFIEQLLKAVSNDGTIFVYNRIPEEYRLKEIIDVFPQYERRIKNMLNRIKDLMMPFEERYLYHPAQKGSAYLKAVLPAWVPDIADNGLAVKNGISANEQYEKLLDDKISKEARQKIMKDLLAYCKMDTYGMVRLLKVLESIVLEKRNAA